MDEILTEQSKVEAFLREHPIHNDILKPFKFGFDEHWKREFIDFWQTIWSVQSLYRNLGIYYLVLNYGLFQKP